MSPTLQAYADILRPKARYKLWQFSGLALVAALVVWGNISSKREAAQEATFLEAVESKRVFHLTKLPPLTYPLIIEELRPEKPLRGRFSFPHIADPDADAGIAQRASACPL